MMYGSNCYIELKQCVLKYNVITKSEFTYLILEDSINRQILMYR